MSPDGDEMSSQGHYTPHTSYRFFRGRTPSREIGAVDIVELTSQHTNSSSNTVGSTIVRSRGKGELDHLLANQEDHESLSHTDVPAVSSADISAHGEVHRGPNTPVPAAVIFARKAAPLYLPQLDKYLAGFPRPPFVPGHGRSTQMFPPMDRLISSGMTLDDLESNDRLLPGWKYRKNTLAIIYGIIGILGSSLLATYYSLQGLFDTVQIFALLLSTIVPMKGSHLKSNWRKLLLGTIPNVLALNFGNTLSQSILFLVMFMVIAFVLLYVLHRYSMQCEHYTSMEGLQPGESKSSQWGLVIVTFLLTVIYLPLSTMAVHVLVWSQDLWVVPNPYLNATSFPPSAPPLGPLNVYRRPLDFCWTTTMKLNQVNYAPLLVISAFVTILFLTVWFPMELRRVIRRSVPKVDRFTELGRRRNTVELDDEYQRLLLRDHNSFAYLYNGFRRGWETYESMYLFAKLSTLLIIATIDPNNCLFRSAPRTVVLIGRQVLLLVAMIAFFAVQCVYAPFMDPVNNASEWTSRLNYVTTSVISLLDLFNLPGRRIIDTYLLYSIYVITYGLTLYFTVINWTITQHLVQRIAKRLDFSIDIFSPRLDISKSSIHVKRRIWQDSITTLFLTTTSCAIPKNHQMIYIESGNYEYPPYLLNFQGTPGERHVENLKVLKEVGSLAYSQAIALEDENGQFHRLENEILENFVGPDCFWRKPEGGVVLGYSKYFGNAWWIPFPPMLVLRYDDGSLGILQSIGQLEEYIIQNTSREVQQKRQIRLALRALDGMTVQWPYQHITPIGTHHLWSLQCCKRNRYHAGASRQFQTCTLQIKRRGYLIWNEVQLGSGFGIQLKYARDVQVSGDAIGLNDDLDLTTPLANFLELNQHLISSNIHHIEKVLSNYRQHQRNEYKWKRQVLSYRFLSVVFDRPRDLADNATSFVEHERDIRVRQLVSEHKTMLTSVYDRYVYVTQTEVTAWWYIFWDDLWRRNSNAIAALRRYATDFDPYYSSSIAYTPLPRAVLENFLAQRVLLSERNFFHIGLLNKVYLRLNEIAFKTSHKAIVFHIGDGSRELDMDEVDAETQGSTSTLGTGDGTDYDAPGIRVRPAYRWEGLLEDPIGHGKRRRRWLAKLGVWFGITPLWRTGLISNGLSLDVRLDNGRYVIIK
ncbi:hypothetical protein AX15_001834 [Amanita polypyramis BW_CC]|nr:hypothetical protein AX15_001834 [Amanita polypyramis BW_CC]